MRGYRQISNRDRVKISRLKAAGLSNAAIANKLGFHRSTISREFKRNSDCEDFDPEFWNELNEFFPDDPVDVPVEAPHPRDDWTAESAIKNREFRVWKANQKRRRKSAKTIRWVVACLRDGWAPEQIAGRSKIQGPDSISHECIYAYIARDRKNGGRLFTLLKRFRKRKRRLSHRSYQGQLPGRVFIDRRPRRVERRIRIGDLEADLICGQKARGYLLTVVDRVSRRVILKRIRTKTKEDTFLALCKAIEEMKVVRTITVDNGKEFALHRELTRTTGAKVYFTHPYTSQEKGTVENTNGLVRYYFNSKANFLRKSDRQIKYVEEKLNNRPRKVLGYLTPNEVHRKKLKEELAKKRVALDS